MTLLSFLILHQAMTAFLGPWAGYCPVAKRMFTVNYIYLAYPAHYVCRYVE